MSRVPTRIGKYPIDEKIAEGGMGAVYKGTHPTLNRPVILKKLTLKGNPQFVERFKREAMIMMDFKNDNIVSFYDHFKAGESYYIVLEYVDGPSIQELLKQQRYISSDLALHLFLSCCKALKYAHDRNVIHRDIKPANILLTKKGELKLMDFGIAQNKDDDSDNDLTTEGMALGTPSYMAPEQFENSKSVDNRADIYSMGVMLYELVTGKKPYVGGLSVETVMQIQKGSYPPPTTINPHIHPLVTRIIKKCMKVRPDRRYSDVGDVIKIIERYFRGKDTHSITRELDAYINNKKFTPREPSNTRKIGKIAAIALISLAAVSAGGFFLYQSGVIHELFLKEQFGRVNLQVMIPKEYKTAAETYAKAQLFLDDDNEIPDVNTDIIFKEVPDMETETHFVLEAGDIYLKTGHYRMKLKLENTLSWYNFFVSARSVQISDGYEEGRNIVLKLDNLPTSTVAVNWNIVDRFTKENITDDTSILFAAPSGLVDFSDFNEDLLSGKVYHFKFSRPNYYDKYFIVKVDPYQNSLNFELEMVPLPGAVSFYTELKRVKILINGSGSIETGGSQGQYMEIPEFDENGMVLLYLNPGNYTLEISSGRQVSYKEITIVPNSNFQFNITQDEESKQIIF